MIALAHDAVTRALSPRQREVADLVADGCTDKEIAAQLGVALVSVRTYRKRACQRLGIVTGDSRVMLARAVIFARSEAA